jgi:hypothetical protein
MGIHFRRALFLAALVAATASTARAQCQAWSADFGVTGVDGHVFALTTFDDGSGRSLFVGGLFDRGPGGVYGPYCGRWSGHDWNGLASNMNGRVSAWAEYDDGSGNALWAGGDFSYAGSAQARGIARWNGSTWSAPTSGPFGGVLALTAFDDGSGPALYAGGSFYSAGPSGTANVARWNGSTWSSVGGGLDGLVRALAVYDDGTGPALYAGGEFNIAGGVGASRLARWNGTSWTSVGGGVDGEVYALTVYDDGSGARLIVSGHFDRVGTTNANYIAAWNGTSWSPLGNGTNWIVSALTVFDDGSGPALYAGGSFTLPALRIARWNGSTWSSVGGGITSGGLLVSALCGFDDGHGPKLYVAGTFDGVGGGVGGGLPCENIAVWNGASWSALVTSQGFDGQLAGFATFDDGTGASLYAFGNFNHAGPTWAPALARWNGSTWLSVPGVTDFGFTGACAYDDGTGPGLYCGHASVVGGITTHIARWNGTTWSPLGAGLPEAPPVAMQVFDDGTGPALYVTGHFVHAGGSTSANVVNNIARWNGASWSSVGGGFIGYAGLALCVFDDGSGPALYLGGEFSTVGPVGGEVPANHIARWNGTSWSALGAGFTGYVSELKAFDDGSGPALYATHITNAGLFDTGVARWNGSTWTDVGNPTDSAIHALEVFDDGSGPALYAAGQFTSIDGVVAYSIARWNGTVWSGVGGGTNPWPSNGLALHAHDDGTGTGPSLWLGGQITSIGGNSSLNVARWSSCGNVGVPFCFGDGTATACPCGNSGAPGNGCASSFDPNGARLSAHGLPDVTDDTLVLAGSATSNSIVTYFQGTTRQNGGAGSVFGDGLRCAGGAIIRLGSVQAIGGQSHYPDVGQLAVSVRGAVPPGGGVRRTYQVWYRNAASFCTSSTFNLSNGLEVTWAP